MDSQLLAFGKSMELLNTHLVKTALASTTTVSLLKKTVPKLDKWLMKRSRGWVNIGLQTTALITARGAKSGQAREFVTLAMPAGNDLLLVASNWGRDRHPSWYLNLRANPDVVVQYRGYRGPMQATQLSGKERSAMWQRLVAYNPQYAVYQQGTSRQLPVLQLRRPPPLP